MDALQLRAGPITVGAVEEVVDEAVRDELDPWELEGLISRIPRYYGEDAEVAYAVLDLLATRSHIDFAALKRHVDAAHQGFGGERLRRLVSLLKLDHYVTEDADRRLEFQLDAVRRSWVARRYLDDA